MLQNVKYDKILRKGFNVIKIYLEEGTSDVLVASYRIEWETI